MRLVTYGREGHFRSGVAVGDRVLDAGSLAGSGARWSTTRAIVAAGPEAWSRLDHAARKAAAAGDGLRREDVTLGPPVPDPDKILCIGLNYREHAREANLPLPAVPTVFAKFRSSLIGPGAAVELPALSQAIDYEAELAVVIGRRARHVAAADALSHVAGVMPFNDVTARDVQFATSQWTAGKAIDTFAPCGPELVLLDEIDDVHDLPVRARVNGELVQDGSTADLIFDVGQLIEFLSSLMTLVPGDIIATGTPAGVGVARDPQLLLKDGDVVEVEIGGVGTLSNPFRPERLAAGPAAAASDSSLQPLATDAPRL